MSDVWHIDPDEVLNFVFDWAALENGRDGASSNWLDRTSSPVESISTATVTPEDSPGITLVSTTITNSNTSVTVKLSAANATRGQKYRLRCEIVTSSGQTAQRTAIVFVTNK